MLGRQFEKPECLFVLDRKPGLIADLCRQDSLKVSLIEKRLLVSPVLDLVNEQSISEISG